MFNIFIVVFCFIVLSFQGAYAEKTENNFRKHLNCFKAIEDKTVYNSNRYASGYFENEDIAILPDPSDSHTWLIVTEKSICHHKFAEKEPVNFYAYPFYYFSFNKWRQVWTSNGSFFELLLPNGERAILNFQYMQRVENGPFYPTLSSYLATEESHDCKSPPACTRLEPNEKIDNTTRQIITDALAERIQTVYRSFSELNYQDIPQDDFITALDMCTSINDRLDSMIKQGKTKF